MPFQLHDNARLKKTVSLGKKNATTGVRGHKQYKRGSGELGMGTRKFLLPKVGGFFSRKRELHGPGGKTHITLTHKSKNKNGGRRKKRMVRARRGSSVPSLGKKLLLVEEKNSQRKILG